MEFRYTSTFLENNANLTIENDVMATTLNLLFSELLYLPPLSFVGHVGNGDGSSSSSGHIKVVVRVRPPNSQEIEGNYKNIVEVIQFLGI